MLSSTIDLLKNTSSLIKSLRAQEVMPRTKDEIQNNTEIKIKIAQEIITAAQTLQNNLQDIPYGSDPKTNALYKAQSDINQWASIAKSALLGNPSLSFELSTLLIPRGSKDGDKDDLERILDDLEKIA